MIIFAESGRDFPQIVTEKGFVAASQSFEEATRGGDREAMLAYCGSKVEASAGEEAETWAFLRILFDTESRR